MWSRNRHYYKQLHANTLHMWSRNRHYYKQLHAVTHCTCDPETDTAIITSLQPHIQATQKATSIRRQSTSGARCTCTGLAWVPADTCWAYCSQGVPSSSHSHRTCWAVGRRAPGGLCGPLLTWKSVASRFCILRCWTCNSKWSQELINNMLLTLEVATIIILIVLLLFCITCVFTWHWLLGQF